MMLPHLFVVPSRNKGRGAYTSQAIAAGTIIEIFLVLVCYVKEKKYLKPLVCTNIFLTEAIHTGYGQ